MLFGYADASIIIVARNGTSLTPVASGATYAPFGPLTALSYGNGLALAAQYDEDYQPSARLVAGTATVQDLTYGFDAAGNVTGITDLLAGARSQTFQYDALDRLTYASGLYGALTYGYDAVGNRTSQSGGDTNLAETYSYAATSNQLQSVVNGGVTRSISYTPTGNTLSDNHGNGTVLNFTYNEARRVVQVANQNQALASYTYNFQGQRAQKTTPSSITNFIYSEAGNLLAEADGTTGAAQTEYIWLDDTPLALVTSGNLYFIHADHLNTPQKATDANQNLAWDAVLRPFGQVEQQTFPPLTNLRFPGQYFDVESALHQNWFRDFDPSTGRYVASDPIGLAGGINTYAFVLANPLKWFDKRGLAIGDYPPPPPGLDPNTWSEGQWPNGNYWVRDPEGNTYTLHPEDAGHWRHWDKQDKDNNDQGQCPPNSGKPRPGQKKLKPNQSATDPNGDAQPWSPSAPQPEPDLPLPLVPVDPIPAPDIPILELPPVIIFE